MDNILNQLKRTGQNDQIEAVMGTIAKVVGAYYTELVAAGLPETMAGKLTEEFHTKMVDKFTASWGQPQQGTGK